MLRSYQLYRRLPFRQSWTSAKALSGNTSERGRAVRFVTVNTHVGSSVPASVLGSHAIRSATGVCTVDLGTARPPAYKQLGRWLRCASDGSRSATARAAAMTLNRAITK
jgi:hypothetical protein